ncbi:DNA polymerase III subunit chi [Thioalkalivibrio sp. XN8]|uniref:DNA polymerase III subunit chi n=1 Tax=Thioalkalivibrio sp. XN8 TaxID=2712863 RepID=UPI0013EBC0F5|nr:DNA polymerase III subunit chi [Thioalkalivibrio sp. XN8]NGP51923.1 DNA polymerase III subunit chi [Thioalkalivibrio sp. XN8]
MTRVDFYVLDAPAVQARELFACRLTEKAWRLQHRVYLHAASAEAARQVDQLLWTFRDGSFVPHSIDTEDLDPAVAGRTPVRIGAGGEPRFEAELLINLGAEVPLFFSRFDRVAEIVAGTDEEKAAARERFRFYRDRGYALATHQIGASRA